MAVENDAVERFAALGYSSLSNQLGVRLLAHVMQAQGAVVLASPLNWSVLLLTLKA
jgi:hypothetical protein